MWGESVADTFEEKTRNFLDILAEFPEVGTVEVQDKQIYGFQLSSQTRLFYRIKGEKIIILSLFDVRQNSEESRAKDDCRIFLCLCAGGEANLRF